MTRTMNTDTPAIRSNDADSDCTRLDTEALNCWERDRQEIDDLREQNAMLLRRQGELVGQLAQVNSELAEVNDILTENQRRELEETGKRRRVETLATSEDDANSGSETLNLID